jgi:hypothetical protein
MDAATTAGVGSSSGLAGTGTGEVRWRHGWPPGSPGQGQPGRFGSLHLPLLACHSLPSHLYIPSTFHLKPDGDYTRSRTKKMTSSSLYLIANGIFVILQIKFYHFIAQRPAILQITCAIWAAPMGILFSPIRRISSLSMCSLVPR